MKVKKYDAIVIGSGYGGLSSAALLAQEGYSVIILEKSNITGGRSSYFEKEGFVWQYGQHSHRCGPAGHAAQLFRLLGMDIDFIDYSGDSFLFYKGKLHKRPEGLGGFLTTKILSLGARISFIKLYIALLKASPNDWYDKTFGEFMKRSGILPEAADFAQFLGMTIMLPDNNIVSAGEVIDFVQRVKKAKVKLGEPAGGAKQILGKLTDFLRQNGCKIKTGQPVDRIIVKNGKITGAAVGETVYESDIVVYSAPLDLFPPLAEGTGMPDEFLSKCSSIIPSSGLVIDFISREPLSDIKGGILGVDIPLWVKFQTNIDNSVAPRGYHVTTWGTLTPYGKAPSADDFGAAEKKLREIASVCMPGYEKMVESERVIRIKRVNGVLLNTEQSRPHRVPVVSEYVKGLYFTGDTVQADGCSGDIAFSSAMKLMAALKTSF